MNSNLLSLVKEVREKTGVSLALCKKTIEDLLKKGFDPSLQDCIDELRKAGTSVATKKAGRDMSNGHLFVVKRSNICTILSLSCETDFVANSDGFYKAIMEIKKCISLKNEAIKSSEDLREVKMLDGKTISEFINYQIALFGENISIDLVREYNLINNQSIFFYTHGKNQNGFEFECGSSITNVIIKHNSDNLESIEKIGRSLAMHIFAAKPIAVSDDKVPTEKIEKEKEIIKEQLVGIDKPENVIEKMATGKLKKFFDENVLLRQSLVTDPSQTVEQFIEKNKKELSCEMSIVDFAIN